MALDSKEKGRSRAMEDGQGCHNFDVVMMDQGNLYGMFVQGMAM